MPRRPGEQNGTGPPRSPHRIDPPERTGPGTALHRRPHHRCGRLLPPDQKPGTDPRQQSNPNRYKQKPPARPLRPTELNNLSLAPHPPSLETTPPPKRPPNPPDGEGPRGEGPGGVGAVRCRAAPRGSRAGWGRRVLGCALWGLRCGGRHVGPRHMGPRCGLLTWGPLPDLGHRRLLARDRSGAWPPWDRLGLPRGSPPRAARLEPPARGLVSVRLACLGAARGNRNQGRISPPVSGRPFDETPALFAGGEQTASPTPGIRRNAVRPKGGPASSVGQLRTSQPQPPRGERDPQPRPPPVEREPQPPPPPGEREPGEREPGEREPGEQEPGEQEPGEQEPGEQEPGE